MCCPKKNDNRNNYESFCFLKVPGLLPVTVVVVVGLPDAVVVPMKSKHHLASVAL